LPPYSFINSQKSKKMILKEKAQKAIKHKMNGMECECKPKRKRRVFSYDPDAPTYDPDAPTYDPDAPTYDPSLDVNGYTLEDAVSEFGEAIAENFINPLFESEDYAKTRKERKAARRQRKELRKEARQEKRISRIKGRQAIREARAEGKIREAGLKGQAPSLEAEQQADQVNQLQKAVAPSMGKVSASQVPSGSGEEMSTPSYATLDMPGAQPAPEQAPEATAEEQAPEIAGKGAEAIEKAVPEKGKNKTMFLIIGIAALGAIIYFMRKK